MKKWIGLASLFLIGCQALTSLPKSNQEYIVNQKNIIETLQYLTSDELEGRNVGTVGIEKAAQYLENLLKNHGISPYFSTYRDTILRYEPISFNIVGYIEGKDPNLKNEFVILSAHYDHIGINLQAAGEDKINNGANDNASGTTILSEIAKYISRQDNKRSVMIVFFSAEEKGLLGSKHLAEKLHSQNFKLYALLNFEMMGVPMHNRPYDLYITGPKTSNMMEKINQYAGYQLVGVLPEEKKYNLFAASDNFPFYKTFDVPSQTVCSFDFQNYSYYHQPEDEFHRMDIPFITSITQKLLPVVSQIINSKPDEIQSIR